MRINTLCKKIFYSFLFFGITALTYGQCPTAASLQTYCDIQFFPTSPTVANLVATNTGGGVVWYDSATSTTPLSNGFVLVNGASYFADNSAGTCAVRPSVTVTIYGRPLAQPFQGPCVDNQSDATVADLTATGNNIRWYSSISGGSPLSPTAILIDNAFYYASQTNPFTGCETSRRSVQANVGLVPVPTGDSIQLFCNTPAVPPTLDNLVVSGNNNWYTSETSEFAIPPGTPLVSGTYYATTIDLPCESISRFEVQVQLIEPANPGVSGVKRICVNELANFPAFSLFGELSGTADVTGTWSGPLTTSGGNLGTVDLSTLTLAGSPYTFTYTVSATPCLDASSTVTIFVEPLPTVTISTTNANVCFGGNGTVNFTGTPGATVTYSTGSGPNQVVTLNGLGTFTLDTDFLTLDTTYSLISVSSSGVPSCTNVAIGSVTFTVIALPVASISTTTPSVCAGSAATINFNGTPNAIIAYTINGVANQIGLDALGFASLITLPLAVDTIISLSSVTSSFPISCTKILTESTTITALPLPTASLSSSLPSVCSETTATLTFAGTPFAIITYKIDTNPNQTISLDSSGQATIDTAVLTVPTTYTLIGVAYSGVPSCSQPLTESITIGILPLPTASISSSTLSICSESTATINFTGTPNSTVTYNVDATSNQTITLNGAGTASILTPVLTSNSVYTLVSVSSAGSPICVQPLEATITIAVTPLPTASISSANLNICADSTAAIAFIGTPNATVTYTINSVSNQIALDDLGTATLTTLPLSANATISLISITSSGSPSCFKSLSESITINVETLPTATISSTQLQTCFGTAATVVFSGTPNATVDFTVDGVANQTVLDNSGNASFITSILTVPSIYTLISVTSGSLLSCTKLLSESITIAILPLPVAAISSTTLNICNGTSGTIDFSGTPFAVVTYSVDGVIQTIPLDASGGASIITPSLSSNTIYSLISVSSTENPICTRLLNDSITIQVDPIPNLIVGTGSTICSGENASILLIGTPNTVVTYNLGGGTNLTIPIDASGTATISNTYTTTTVVNFVSISTQGTPGCNVSLTNTITIQVSPLPTATISSPTLSICTGSNATINFTGTPFATVTYTANNVSNSILLNASGSATLQSNISVETNYTLVSVVAQGQLSCTSPLSESLTIDIVNLPIATISSSGIFCAGSLASILFTGTPNSVVTYNVNGESTSTVSIGPSGNFTLSLPLLVTSTFNLVSIILDGPPSCSQLLTGSTTITVIQPPQAGSNAALSICSNGATQNLFELLGATAQPGGTWSPVLASGTGVFDPTTDPAGNYVYTVAGTPPCANDTALVTVTIVPQANAGNGDFVTLCSNLDPVDLTNFLGGSPQTGGSWSPLFSSGTNFFDPSTDLAGTYVYTVNGDAPCGNDSASVVVNINQGTSAGVSTSLTVCVNSPSQFLFQLLGPTAAPGGTWLGLNGLPLASGTDEFVPGTDLAQPYIYTISGSQPCDNDTSTVTVTVNPLPDAGEDATTNICSNSDPVDLLIRLGGTPQDGGVWTPALASGNNFFNPTLDLAQNYTYTVGAPFCTPDTSVLTVVVVQGPDAGVSGSVTVCANGSPINLFDSLGGSPQPGGTWLGADGFPLSSGTDEFVPVVDVAQIYTYSLQGNQSCDNDTATVDVTVSPLPNAGTFVGNQDVCASFGAFDLFSLLTGNQLGGLWTDSDNEVVTSTIDLANFAQGVYTYTYTVSNSCGPDDTETVQFTVLNPTLEGNNIVVSSPNCSGENVVVTFSNLVDGEYIFNYDLTLANVLLNQNAAITILNGSGTIEIDESSLPVVGTTRVTFLSITNSISKCATLLTPNVSADFIVQPSSNIESGNLSVSNVCFGNSIQVQITGATGLTDGTYKFVYSIPSATPIVETTDEIIIVGGAGQFTIANNVFSTFGSYSLTIDSILNLSGGCDNLDENASTDFEIYEIPDLSNAVLSADTACVNFSNEVSITNGLNQIILTDGSYVITYELSGSATGTLTDTVDIADNLGVFTIPASNLNIAGSVTVTITQIASAIGACDAVNIGIDPVTFEVSELETPTLLPKGNEFCISDSPTISNLSANISGTQTVVWYNAAAGGTAFTDSDLLIDMTTYYAASISASGCESVTRLPVTVDLTKCDDILIPDGFSPNGDTVNDEFVLKDIEIGYPAFTLEIYNRHGNILYKGNINTPNWDGTTTEGGMKLGNNVAPVGVYFYILNFNDGVREAKQGRLYLSR